MDIEKDSFKPQEFRSSRSQRHNPSSTTTATTTASAASTSRNEHDNAMFGPINSTGAQAMFNPIQPAAAAVGLNSSSSVTIAEKSLLNSAVSILISFLVKILNSNLCPKVNSRYF